MTCFACARAQGNNGFGTTGPQRLEWTLQKQWPKTGRPSTSSYGQITGIDIDKQGRIWVCCPHSEMRGGASFICVACRCYTVDQIGSGMPDHSSTTTWSRASASSLIVLYLLAHCQKQLREGYCDHCCAGTPVRSVNPPSRGLLLAAGISQSCGPVRTSL